MATQPQQTDPSVRTQNIPFNPLRTASVKGRNVLLSTDKNYLFTPDDARHLAQQLLTSADMAEHSGHSNEPDNKTLQEEAERKPANNFHHQSTYFQSATKWRQENNYTGKGGIVALWNGKVQGWVNELRDPQSWKPGCIAVDENGSEWITTGGNNYNGAKSWEIVFGSIPEKLPEYDGKRTDRQLPSNLTKVPGNKTLQDELKLIHICKEIGGIAGSNRQYTLSLTLHIKKPVESLTVAQLLSFHRECNQRFNQEVQSWN